MATTAPEKTPPASQPKAVVRVGDAVFSTATLAAGILILLILAGVALFLLFQSLPVLKAQATDPESITGGGFFAYVWPLIIGTLVSAFIALLVATPFSLGIALFTTHMAPRKLAPVLGYTIDLLAAIPSVVYGLWGLMLASHLVPIYAWLATYFGWIPIFAPTEDGGISQTGRTMLTASLVLSIMILPIITSLIREVFLQTPRLQEEAALALGATRWETIRTVVLPFGRGGVVAASMLGLGRALGETMAVLMILAPGATFSLHILEVGRHNSIAANIASKSAEASGVDMSLLIFTGLVLFVLTFVINAIARWIVARSGPRS